jgi:hypothetical protein
MEATLTGSRAQLSNKIKSYLRQHRRRSEDRQFKVSRIQPAISEFKTRRYASRAASIHFPRRAVRLAFSEKNQKSSHGSIPVKKYRIISTTKNFEVTKGPWNPPGAPLLGGFAFLRFDIGDGFFFGQPW